MIPHNKENPMIFNREPALILAAVQAVLAVAVGFGLDLTNEQTALILAAVAAVIGVIVRSRVSPVDEP